MAMPKKIISEEYSDAKHRRPDANNSSLTGSARLILKNPRGLNDGRYKISEGVDVFTVGHGCLDM